MKRMTNALYKYSYSLMVRGYAYDICHWPNVPLDEDDKIKLMKAARKLLMFLKEFPQYNPKNRTTEESLYWLAGQFFMHLLNKNLETILPGYPCHYKTWAGFKCHLMPRIEPRNSYTTLNVDDAI